MIGILTDIHAGYEFEVDHALERAIAEFESRAVEHILVLGDVLHELEEESQAEARQRLRAVTAPIRECAIPSTILAGNHDALALTIRDFNDIAGGMQVDIVELGPETGLVTLETAYGMSADHVGYIGPLGRDALSQATMDYDTVMVASHYPLVYTPAYRDNGFFGEYPEAVFAVDKKTIEVEISGYVVSGLYGHMHQPLQWSAHDADHYVFEPFTTIPGGELTGAVHLVDYDECGVCAHEVVRV